MDPNRCVSSSTPCATLEPLDGAEHATCFRYVGTNADRSGLPEAAFSQFLTQLELEKYQLNPRALPLLVEVGRECGPGCTDRPAQHVSPVTTNLMTVRRREDFRGFCVQVGVERHEGVDSYQRRTTRRAAWYFDADDIQRFVDEIFARFTQWDLTDIVR
jgi:hypothetical protein